MVSRLGSAAILPTYALITGPEHLDESHEGHTSAALSPKSQADAQRPLMESSGYGRQRF